MICNPPVIGTVPLDTSLSSLLKSFGGQLQTWNQQNYTYTSTTLLDCYAAAAKASALQMIKERNARRKEAGLLALIPITFSFDYNGQAGRQMWWANSEDFWFNGTQNWCHLHPDDPNSDIGWWCGPGNPQYYEGDYNLSLRQMILDDLAEQNGQVMQPLTSPDGITTYSPDRLAEIQLAETYRALQAQEEAALQLLAQTQSASTVAAISTTQTVTDPIGRLVVGEITQNVAGGIPSAPTDTLQVTPSPVQNGSVKPAQLADAIQSPPAAGSPAITEGSPTATVARSAANPGGGTAILAALAVAATFLMGRK